MKPLLKQWRLKQWRSTFFVLSMIITTAVHATEDIEEIVVRGDLGSLPGEDVKSIFGFNKSLLETPRSASTISEEMMDRFNMQDIDELITLAPGSFTQSFFGVAGALDVRGTPGETYFRGVRRLDNPGNYPTPIGASDRVDIIRGPASPIYGPSKIGGYLNFNPKSARVEEDGQYVYETSGTWSYTFGDWNKSILTTEVGGPSKVGNQELGYYLYAELEDSGSYYRNSTTEQTLVQASFDMDLTDNVRLQFGGMYHAYDGNQNAGWNRLTQDLIDHGTYVTGSPLPHDANGDGSISHQEYFAAPTSLAPFFFGAPSNVDLIDLAAATGQNLDLLALQNPGTATLDGSQTLVAADDTLENEVITLYFDIIAELESDWQITNQLFYETYDNLNENAYGFSQFHDAYTIEDKLIFAKVFTGDSLTTSLQLSPSIRYTDFEHGDDFINEFFDRRDLTGPSTALDRRLLATRINDDYSTYDIGNYLNLGVAALADFTWNFGLSALIGVRYDSIDLQSRTPDDLLLSSTGADMTAKDTVHGISWNVSLSYEIADAFIPYVTVSEQSTLIAGQGANIEAENIADNSAFDQSELLEIGIKGSLLDNALYFAIAFYKQERTDFSAQSIVTNQTSNSEGAEFELRWVVNENLILTAGYSKIEVINLTTANANGRFSFIGAEDLPNVAPEALYGGVLLGIVSPSDGRRAGIPENIYSLTGTYDFNNGFAVSGSLVNVDAVPSSLSGSVTLPEYTLLNASLVYESQHWALSITGKNLTDERYFRANFPNLFGATIVLPELPRHFQARIQYLF